MYIFAEKLQPYGSIELPKRSRPRSFAAVQGHEGHWNIEATGSGAVNSSNV